MTTAAVVSGWLDDLHGLHTTAEDLSREKQRAIEDAIPPDVRGRLLEIESQFSPAKLYEEIHRLEVSIREATIALCTGVLTAAGFMAVGRDWKEIIRQIAPNWGRKG